MNRNRTTNCPADGGQTRSTWSADRPGHHLYGFTMNRIRTLSCLTVLAALAVFASPHAAAQTTIAEDFTGTTTTNPWWYFNGACLTAGASSQAGSEPSGGTGGQLPGCVAIGIGGSGPLYYNQNLVGGQNGVTGSSQTLPDPAGQGALRFTNGNPGGFSQNGGIVSTTPFPTGQGVSITFKTVTYRGNSGGAAGDGADGISFFLMDSTKLNTAEINGVASGDGNGLGAWGGSLGYTCSNVNTPFNGLNGGYIAVGIDEYGNFLNGTTNSLGESGTTASGDNTYTGGGYKPGRIGLRGAGSIDFNALTTAYGTNPGSSSLPYYPATLATSCLNSGGTYSSSTGLCETCGSGTTFNSSTGMCEKCSGGATYNSSTNTCDSCASGTYDATTNQCETCATGTYNAATNTCESCASGTYDPTTNTCQSCTTGTYNPTANECEICASGTYNATSNTCDSCSSGTYDATTNMCETCATGAYDAAANTCESCASGTYYAPTNKCETCASGTYNSATNKCEVCSGSDVWISASNVCCPVGDTWNGTKCTNGVTLVTKGTLTTPNPTASAPNNPVASSPQSPTQSTPGTAPPNNPTASTPNSPTASSPGSAQPDSIYAVKSTCANGTLYNYSTANSPTNAGSATLTNSANTAGILDYAAVPGAYVVLPSTTQIANESAMSRGAATPIFYQLSITQNGLLSLSYSINSGASYQPVISSQSITASNGPLPSNFLFGFAGSTGGSTNIHEILCFKAAPNTTSASSAGASQRQSAQLETGEQAYFAYYNPGTWTGTVTANPLGIDSFNNITIGSPTWDAGCVLTGLASGTSCASTGAAGPAAAAPSPTGRVALSWNGTQGIPFEWNSLTTGATGQQTVIDAGDTTTYAGNSAYSVQARLNYLRGDRTNEISSAGVGLFRARTDVIADIVDSSPVWVGPPMASFPTSWTDRLNTSATSPENATTAQPYSTYNGASGQGGRLNVVYIGSNDGFVHGFRTGSYNVASRSYVYNATTPNDGQEVLAYMPGAVVQTIHSTNPDVDYSNTQYEHNFFVDATPGTGDLFYDNAWHTWLVGGLAAGGDAIYALDVTNPANFSEANASSLVMGEWTPSTISCANVANCGNNLGNTYGTPVIRRLHDGNWGVIFGNGFGSASGDAGIYVMVIPASTSTAVPSPTMYYLSAGSGSPSSPNGIAYAAAADLDGDHITDYVYAGDLAGNIWRFDLTSATESNWKVSPGPLFTTPAGQPITTNLIVADGTPPGTTQRYLMVLFGTGQKTPMSQTSPATYASGTQSLYGVWDWNVSASDGGEDGPGAGNPQGWDGIAGAQYASLTRANTGLSAPYTLTQANLVQQIVTINTGTAAGNRDITTNATVCWKGTTICTTGGNNQFGWYLNLPGTQEQVVYNPELVQQALTVNSIVPAALNPTACTIPTDTGFTYLLNALTGGAFASVFLPPNDAGDATIAGNPHYTDTNAVGIQNNATGSSFIAQNNAGISYLINETNAPPPWSGSSGGGTSGGSGTSGTSPSSYGSVTGANIPANSSAKPLSWVERR